MYGLSQSCASLLAIDSFFVPLGNAGFTLCKKGFGYAPRTLYSVPLHDLTKLYPTKIRGRIEDKPR